MSEEYLVQLSEAYTRFFHQYEEAPILIVNTASLNPIDREEDFEALVSQIANFRGRRAYFNLAG
jgi:deoxyadenosine/deoxycytidine kinase